MWPLVVLGLLSLAGAERADSTCLVDLEQRPRCAQNTVMRIVQTRDGYLWLATLCGLARDGATLTTFHSNNYSPWLRRGRFTSLFEDRDGCRGSPRKRTSI